MPVSWSHVRCRALQLYISRYSTALHALHSTSLYTPPLAHRAHRKQPPPTNKPASKSRKHPSITRPTDRSTDRDRPTGRPDRRRTHTPAAHHHRRVQLVLFTHTQAGKYRLGTGVASEGYCMLRAETWGRYDSRVTQRVNCPVAR